MTPRCLYRAALPLLMSALVLPSLARAANEKGEFAIKGIGATECATAVREYKAGTPNAMMYGGWIYGYLTALNQLTPGTFDLASWQDLNTLTSFIVEYCEKNEKTPFSQAVFKMATALNPQRLTARSDPVRITVSGRPFVMYAETISRVAAQLAAKGFLKDGHDPKKPEFNDKMVQALKSFQSSRKLKPTGAPTQQTLFELFQR